MAIYAGNKRARLGIYPPQGYAFDLNNIYRVYFGNTLVFENSFKVNVTGSADPTFAEWNYFFINTGGEDSSHISSAGTYSFNFGKYSSNKAKLIAYCWHDNKHETYISVNGTKVASRAPGQGATSIGATINLSNLGVHDGSTVSVRIIRVGSEAGHNIEITT